MWAALFPGQGSQHSGMGRFLYDNFDQAKRLFEEASDTLSVDFKKLCFDGSEADLALTHNTQPCLLLVSTATYRVLENLSDLPIQLGSGHSVGEYAAMVCSGALNFADGMRAVRKRGEYMQSAVPVGQGAMLAVMGLSDDQVRQLCRWAEETSGLKPLEPANFNAPGQIVVSGSAQLVQWVQDNFDKEIFSEPPRKIRFIPLKVSAPFHCSMMKPAEEQMRTVLHEMNFSQPRYGIVQNVTAQPVTESKDLRENLIRQVSSPVRWVECVQQLAQQSVNRCIEFGPGKVLSGLVKKIDSEHLTTFNINSLEDLKAAEQQLNG